MSIFTKIFSGGAKDLVETVGTAIDKIHTSKEEKEVLKNEINKKILQDVGNQICKVIGYLSLYDLLAWLFCLLYCLYLLSLILASLSLI